MYLHYPIYFQQFSNPVLFKVIDAFNFVLSVPLPVFAVVSRAKLHLMKEKHTKAC